MRYKLLLFLILLTLLSCKKYCNQDLLHGEILRIPIEFKNFSVDEVHNIWVYRIDKDSSLKRDTFGLIDIIFTNQIKTNKVSITDDDKFNRFGYYESYFNTCDLIFDWYTGTDTLKNMEVSKSKRQNDDECYKYHPNIRIDHVSFLHKGSIIKKDETVIIEK